MALYEPSIRLVCPETKLALFECSLEEAERSISGGRPLVSRGLPGRPPIGRTPRVLLQKQSGWAYPVVDRTPILLGPERLWAPEELQTAASDPRYEEAARETQFYNEAAQREGARVSTEALPEQLDRILRTPERLRASFPEPRGLWIDAVYDSASQRDAYGHLSPVHGRKILQLGGKGTHAVKFLLAGAAEGWLLSPMVSELAYGLALAHRCGVHERFACAGGVAEQLPFEDESFDAIYAGGCVHHMVTEEAFAECARVLRPGGRFAAAEPWRAPLYALGTKLLGKREPDVHCRPLTRGRVRPLFEAFEVAEVAHHGALTRYPLLALWKLGLELDMATVWRITRLDDALCSPFPWLRGAGSSVSVLGTKSSRVP